MKREPDVQLVDLTKNSVKQEPGLPFTEPNNAPLKHEDSMLSDEVTHTAVQVQHQRSKTPLFDGPNQSSKRAREDGEEVNSSTGAAKKVGANDVNGKQGPIIIPSHGPLTTRTRTSLD